MEELVLENRVTIDATSTVQTQSLTSGIFQNGSLNLIGGTFTPKMDITVTGLGNPLSVRGTVQCGAVYHSASASITGDIQFQFLSTQYGVALKSTPIQSTNGTGVVTGALPSGTSILTVTKGSPAFTASAAATATLTENMRVVGMPVGQTIQLYQITPTPSLLGTVLVVPTSTTASFSSPIPLEAGNTYALASLGGVGLAFTFNRSTTVDNTPFITFNDGFDNSIGISNALPSGVTGLACKGTNTSGQYTVLLDADYSAFINNGELVAAPGASNGTVVVSHTIVSGVSQIIMSQASVSSFTSASMHLWTQAEYLASLSPSSIAGKATIANQWGGEFIIQATTVISEQIDIPPQPQVVASTSQFTITLPASLLPSDLQEYDLQYAKSVDNVTFGDWLDIGTFPAVVTTDASDTSTSNIVGVYQHTAPDTTAPLPYYIYRYRLRTSNYSESAWSDFTYAGQVQAD